MQFLPQVSIVELGESEKGPVSGYHGLPKTRVLFELSPETVFWEPETRNLYDLSHESLSPEQQEASFSKSA